VRKLASRGNFCTSALVNLSPCLTNHNGMKTYGEVDVQLHTFLNLGTGWRWFRAKNRRYPLDRRLGWLQSRFGCTGEEKGKSLLPRVSELSQHAFQVITPPPPPPQSVQQQPYAIQNIRPSSGRGMWTSSHALLPFVKCNLYGGKHLTVLDQMAGTDIYEGSEPTPPHYPNVNK
jgi:hypothetical protein